MSGRRTAGSSEQAVAEIRRLSAAGLDGLALLRGVATALRPVVPFDVSCATLTDPATNLIADAVVTRERGIDPAAPAVLDNYFARVYFEHDLGMTSEMLRTGRSVAQLSEWTGGDPERSGRFRDHLRPRGLGHELYATFVDRGLWGELHLTREAGAVDFTARHVDLLRRIVPYVGAGLKAAGLRGRALVDADADGPGVLVFDRGDRLVSATPAADRWLGELDARVGGSRAERSLPVAVTVVLAALDRSLADGAGDGTVVPRLQTRGRSGRRLTLHAALTQGSEFRPSERIVVIAPAVPERPWWREASPYGLTDRETEVVDLVVRGRSTREIADELFIAEHTVQRHLSNIFEKVGVRGRRALVKRLFVEHVVPGFHPD